MYALLDILAEPLASYNLWPALVFFAALVIMPSLATTGSRMAEWRRRRLRRVVR